QCESPPQPQSPPPCQCWDGECNGDGTCANPLPQPTVTWQEECKVGGGDADDWSSCGSGKGYCMNGVCIKDNSSPPPSQPTLPTSQPSMAAYIKCLNEGNQPEDCERQSRETQPPVTPTQTTSQGGSAAAGTVCQAVGQVTNEQYPYECNNGKGVQICHKYGVCAGVGSGIMLSWMEGSDCGPCVDKGTIAPSVPIITKTPTAEQYQKEQVRIITESKEISGFCGTDKSCETRLTAEVAADHNVDIASLTNLKNVSCGQNKDCYAKNIDKIVLSGWRVDKSGDMYLPKDIVDLLNQDGQIYNGNYFDGKGKLLVLTSGLAEICSSAKDGGLSGDMCLNLNNFVKNQCGRDTSCVDTEVQKLKDIYAKELKNIIKYANNNKVDYNVLISELAGGVKTIDANGKLILSAAYVRADIDCDGKTSDYKYTFENNIYDCITGEIKPADFAQSPGAQQTPPVITKPITTQEKTAIQKLAGTARDLINSVIPDPASNESFVVKAARALLDVLNRIVGEPTNTSRKAQTSTAVTTPQANTSVYAAFTPDVSDSGCDTDSKCNAALVVNNIKTTTSSSYANPTDGKFSPDLSTMANNIK
ncbi:MAG: hypothetical protein Q7S14_00610, partial [bacterium]|nr:hypothetical protein [bacterium]